jgi:DNA-binding NarL/FixJ family response regulator
MPSATSKNPPVLREIVRLRELQQRVNARLTRLVSRIAPELEKARMQAEKAGATPQTIAEIELKGFVYLLTRVQCVARKTLTQREMEIASHVARGLSNKRIARELGISASTVASYLRRIFSKLNIPSRVALARWEPTLFS